jgi:adhesin/invasin
VGALLALDGCCDLATAVVPERRTITVLAGDNQEALVGEPVAVPPAVLVTNQRGEAAGGVDVSFAVAEGGGSVTGPTARTDPSGVARVGSWVLGSRPGSNRLTASASGSDVDGNPVTFSATARTGPAAQLTKHAGDAQSAPVAQPVPIAPSVRLVDRFGNPVSGVAIVFAVAGGGGSVSGPTAATDANGVATVGRWTLGPNAGPNSLTATASGTGISGNPATFAAQGVAGAAAAISSLAGNNQQAPVGQVVAVSPAVVVRDQFGNPVSGVMVTFAVTLGGGSVANATPMTNAAGQATVGGWTLGTVAGLQRLTATATGAGIAGNPVAFNATAVAGPATSIAVSAGNNQQAQVGQAVPIAPSVVVRDQFGNPVSGVTVTFAVAGGGGGGGGGSITGAAQTTNASGLATVGSWTLGTTLGVNQLTATAAGSNISGNPVPFTAIAVAGAPAAIALVAGDNQQVQVGQAVPIAPSVVVRDQYGNPVAGVTVTFAVATGSGSVSGAVQVTDSNGIATVGSWTLGLNPGVNTLTATAQGSSVQGNPVTFTARGVP